MEQPSRRHGSHRASEDETHNCASAAIQHGVMDLYHTSFGGRVFTLLGPELCEVVGVFEMARCNIYLVFKTFEHETVA